MGTLKDLFIWKLHLSKGRRICEWFKLAGVGNVVSKTMAQISQLSGRQSPIADSTGTSTAEDQPAVEPIIECTTNFPASRNEGYAVRFIQNALEQAAVSLLHPVVADQNLTQTLQNRYALKHRLGKRTPKKKTKKKKIQPVLQSFQLRCSGEKRQK